MIKILAAFFMLIDHIGAILFSNILVLRVIGRISMPLFAYCIARGFYYSKQKGTIQEYMDRMMVFAVLSQIPYTVFSLSLKNHFSLNIGFTWLCALALLCVVTNDKIKTPVLLLKCLIIYAAAVWLPMDYGLYGILFPCLFYAFSFRKNKPQIVFIGMSLLCVLYACMNNGNLLQAFSLLAFPVLLYAQRYDNKISLPKSFFYWFYPAHITILLLLKFLFFKI